MCENDSVCRNNTWVAARDGHLDCLEFAVSNGSTDRSSDRSTDRCDWDHDTTYAAALYGHLDCLEYIFENCGDIATWENSGLEQYFCDFPEKIQKYIESVKEEWKAGLNHPGKNIKG